MIVMGPDPMLSELGLTTELRALPGGDLFKDWHSQRNFSVQLTFFAMHLWFGMAREIYRFKCL